jgi:hypothetical protein
VSGRAEEPAALAIPDRDTARRGVTVYTQIPPATEFTLAQDTHQKYRLSIELGDVATIVTFLRLLGWEIRI